jgi:hypothetical protein
MGYIPSTMVFLCNFYNESFRVALAKKEDVTPGFRRQTECEPCTCQDQLFTYTAVT